MITADELDCRAEDADTSVLLVMVKVITFAIHILSLEFVDTVQLIKNRLQTL